MKSIVDIVLRWTLGLLFLFSGFVKSVDPVGSAIYVEKYLTTYALDVLSPFSTHIAIALAVVELSLGAALVLHVARRYTLILSVTILSIFSLVTLLSATLLPIGDCGCFGEVLKLSPWATFIKNVVLLAIAVWLLRNDKPQQMVSASDCVVLLFAVCVALSINIYSLRHLPLIDFMPYSVGTPLREAVVAEREAQNGAMQLVFRDVNTGELRYFSQDDTSCWLDDSLEYVDVRSVPIDADMTYADFAIYDDCGEDVSLDLLAVPGRVAWLCVASNEAAQRHLSGIERLLAQYPATAIRLLSSDTKLSVAELAHLGCYAVDAMTLRSIIRAEVGVVILNDGVVEYKSNIDDI